MVWTFASFVWIIAQNIQGGQRIQAGCDPLQLSWNHVVGGSDLLTLTENRSGVLLPYTRPRIHAQVQHNMAGPCYVGRDSLLPQSRTLDFGDLHGAGGRVSEL